MSFTADTVKFHDPTEFKREADQPQQVNQQQQQPPNQPHASEGGSHAHKHGIGEVADTE